MPEEGAPAMLYLKVEWHHNFDDEATVMYSEVDSSGYESRKVEQYRDGHLDWADEESSTGKTEGIAAQDEFTPAIIDVDEFERALRRAKAQGNA